MATCRIFKMLKVKVEVEVKVKVTPEQVTKTQRESRGKFYLSLTSALDGGGLSTSHPGRFTPGKQLVEELRYKL
jgi:hypothetical protein